MPKMSKTPLTDCVTDSMTEAVFYPCFGVVYGRFWVDFPRKQGNLGCFSGKYGVWKGWKVGKYYISTTNTSDFFMLEQC